MACRVDPLGGERGGGPPGPAGGRVPPLLWETLTLKCLVRAAHRPASGDGRSADVQGLGSGSKGDARANDVIDSSTAGSRVPSEVVAGAPGWRAKRAAVAAGSRRRPSASFTFPAARPGPASARLAQPSRRCRGLPAAHQHSGAKAAESRARYSPRGRVAFQRPRSADPRRERAPRGRGGSGGAGAAEGASARPSGPEPDVAQLFP